MAKTAFPSIPLWASPALQGLTYWVGSQHTLGLAANISEGAIAWELSRLLFAHRDSKRVLEAEVLYRHIPELNHDGDLNESRERADLVIARRARANRDESYVPGSVEAIIEIKHNRSPKRLVWRDIDFLGAQRSASRKSVRAFLIYVSVNQRPADFTQASGAAIKPRNRTSPDERTPYRVRRVCRATSRIPRENRKALGHYAVLIEVSPGSGQQAYPAGRPPR